jgi:hypothetical protein
MIAGAITCRCAFVPAVPPGSIHALNSVKQARFLQGFECPVDGYPVDRSCSFLFFEDVLM